MGRLRIVAGRLRGRRIRVPGKPEIRPTADRVREALFGILAGAVVEARVLDLFSGTGALGIEALSRGAAGVVFVEADPIVARVLEENVVGLGVGGRCRVVCADVIAALERGTVADRFGLILADPPYGSGLAERFLGVLARGTWLAEGGWLVVERASGEPTFDVPPGGPALYRSARYGDTRLDFYRAAGGA